MSYPKMRKNTSSKLEVIRVHLLAREAPKNARRFDNVRKDLTHPAKSPRPHLRFSRDHVLLLVLHVYRAHYTGCVIIIEAFSIMAIYSNFVRDCQ